MDGSAATGSNCRHPGRIGQQSTSQVKACSRECLKRFLFPTSIPKLLPYLPSYDQATLYARYLNSHLSLNFFFPSSFIRSQDLRIYLSVLLSDELLQLNSPGSVTPFSSTTSTSTTRKRMSLALSLSNSTTNEHTQTNRQKEEAAAAEEEEEDDSQFFAP